MKKIFIITDSYGTIVEARQTKAQATKRAKELTNEEKGILYSTQPANLCGIAIFGRRHFDKAGNTYHSTGISVFFDNGKVFREGVSKKYGYGDHYVQTGFERLQQLGFFPEDIGWNAAVWLKDNNIGFAHGAADVAREKDL